MSLSPRSTTFSVSNLLFLAALSTFVVFLANEALAMEDVDSQPDDSLFAPAHRIGTSPLEAEGKFFLGGSRSSLGRDAVNASQWSFLSANVSHKPSKITFGFNAGYSQVSNTDHDEETPEQVTAFDSPVMTLSRSWKNGKDFDGFWLDAVSFGLTGTTPGNKDAFDKRFRGSVGPYATLDKTFGRWILSQTLGYSRGFYDEKNIDATVNSPDAFKTLTVLGYNITEKLNLNGSFQSNYALDFAGAGHIKNLWNLSLEYEINKIVDANFGVGSAVGYLSPDAQSDLLDSTTGGAQAYIEIGIAI